MHNKMPKIYKTTRTNHKKAYRDNNNTGIKDLQFPQIKKMIKRCQNIYFIAISFDFRTI